MNILHITSTDLRGAGSAVVAINALLNAIMPVAKGLSDRGMYVGNAISENKSRSKPIIYRTTRKFWNRSSRTQTRYIK
jgi:hypothetical protein